MIANTIRHRRFLSIVGFVLAVIVGVVVGWWAAVVAVGGGGAGSEEGESVGGVVWSEAGYASVGRSLNLSTTVRQPAVVVGVNRFSGVVREVQDGQLDSGELVYRVGADAVRVVESSEPFWRDLGPGVSGSDVAAVQEFLIGAGYLEGDEASGDFDQATAVAVQGWQDELGIEQTGVIRLGEVVAVSSSPVVIGLAEDVRVGMELSGGEEAVQAPTGERSFVLVLMDSQAQQVTVDATVEVTFEEYTWEAVVESVEEGDPAAGGGVEYQLAAADGGEVCGEDCDQLPADPQLSLRSSVEVTAPVQGVGVPAAAVRTAGDGGTYVQTREGQIEVEVLGSGQGVAIVEGVQEGTEVQVFDDGPAPGQQPLPGQQGDSAPGQQSEQGEGQVEDGDEAGSSDGVEDQGHSDGSGQFQDAPDEGSVEGEG